LRVGALTKVKSIGVFSFAKFQAVLTAFIGIIAGIFYSFGGLIIDLSTVGLNDGTALAFLALIGMPVIFAVIGFVIGIIEASIYNLFAKWFDGIKVDFIR
jgi:hypothetical protein